MYREQYGEIAYWCYCVKGYLVITTISKSTRPYQFQAKPVEEFQSVGRRASNDIGYSQDKKSNHWFRWKKIPHTFVIGVNLFLMQAYLTGIRFFDV